MQNSVNGAGATKCEAPLAKIAKTYEKRPSEALRRIQPSQSISVFRRRISEAYV